MEPGCGWMAVCTVQSMYYNARSHVQVNGQYSEEFGVGVWVYQGLVLSPVLFILMIEALWCKFHTVVPWELLYVDDLVLIADSQKECISKLKVWKAGMESKGFRVSMKKTKFMVSSVYYKGVGNNSIEFAQCKRCSSIIGRLVADSIYICPRCNGE